MELIRVKKLQTVDEAVQELWEMGEEATEENVKSLLGSWVMMEGGQIIEDTQASWICSYNKCASHCGGRLFIHCDGGEELYKDKNGFEYMELDLFS